MPILLGAIFSLVFRFPIAIRINIWTTKIAMLETIPSIIGFLLEVLVSKHIILGIDPYKASIMHLSYTKNLYKNVSSK